MDQPLNDAEVERLVSRSAVFRAARAGLTAVDASIASSAIVRSLDVLLSRQSLGLVLIVAGVTHGALEMLAGPASVPAGRFVFALSGLAAGALLLVRSRTH
jgi:hypothetical protein